MRFFTKLATKCRRAVVAGKFRQPLVTLSRTATINVPKLYSVSANDQSPQQDERRLKAKADWEKNIKTIPLNVCSSVYSYWHQKGMTKSKPLNGVKYDVVYADTWPNAPSQTPVVIGLHGTAASHLYFSSLASFMAVNGVRFIVPNFPGCGFTQMDKKRIFNHSPLERAAFVADLLGAIGVTNVKVVVAHSAAAYPGLILTKDQENFESLALINPGGHQAKWITKQANLFKFVLGLIDFGIPLRPLIYYYISKYGKKLPGSNHGAEPFEVGVRSMVLNDYDEIYGMYLEAKWQRIPLLYAYSKNDKVFKEEMFVDLASLLELQSKNMFHYDDSGQLTQTGDVMNLGRYAHGLVFDKGGHAVLHNYSTIIEKAIWDLLTYVKSTSR